MRICILAFLAVFCVTPHAVAEELFSKCDDVLKQPDYSSLRKYLSETDQDGGKKRGDLCQRLNNRGFLYTDEYFHHCESQKGVLSCTTYYNPSFFSVETRFFGNNGKQFVLLKQTSIYEGTESSSYHVFFLAPKSINPRGYVMSLLEGSGEYHTFGAGAEGIKLCDAMYDESDESMDDTAEAEAEAEVEVEVEAITETKKPEIINQGNNPVIRFTQERTLCKSGQVSRQILEYTWQGKQFLKTRDSREPIAKREGE